MNSVNQTTKQYNKLIEKVKTDDFFKVDLTNRVNNYVCGKCAHVTKTIDVDAGVTPFMHECERCGDYAQSLFYRDIATEKKPSQEWYRPSLQEVLKMRNNPGLLDHVLQGGLCNRKIKNQ